MTVTPPPLMKAGPLAPAVLLAQLAQHVLDSASEVRPATIAAIVRAACPHIPGKSDPVIPTSQGG